MKTCWVSEEGGNLLIKSSRAKSSQCKIVKPVAKLQFIDVVVNSI